MLGTPGFIGRLAEIFYSHVNGFGNAADREVAGACVIVAARGIDVSRLERERGELLDIKEVRVLQRGIPLVIAGSHACGRATVLRQCVCGGRRGPLPER
jgi:hypothetical protein